MQDATSLILFISDASKKAAEMALDFVIKNHKEIGGKMGGSQKQGIPVQTTLLPGLARRFASVQQAEKIKNFYENHLQVHGQHSFKNVAVSRIDANRMWLSKHAQEACNWFASR